jgi:hypothetical protein
MLFVLHKIMLCVRNPTVNPKLGAYYDIAQTARQKELIMKRRKERGDMKVSDKQFGINHRISYGSVFHYAMQSRLISIIINRRSKIVLTSVAILSVSTLVVLNQLPYNNVLTTNIESDSTSLPNIVMQDINSMHLSVQDGTSTISPSLLISQKTDTSTGSSNITAPLSENYQSVPSVSATDNHSVQATTENNIQNDQNNISVSSLNGDSTMSATNSNDSNGNTSTFNNDEVHLNVEGTTVTYRSEDE